MKAGLIDRARAEQRARRRSNGWERVGAARNGFWRVAAWAACLLLSTPRVSAAQNLITNGDFELPSTDSPPPGWSMWGDAKHQNPANYTRDTNQPHGGGACLRIHHPANTAGYIVSSPRQAIALKPGMMYAVSFWARSDRPGSASFGFDAYASLKPYVDAPSPGFFPIEVGPDWRPFTFVIHEGWDFFADRTRFVLLTFKATTNQREERTLWIDDVVVTEQPTTRQGRLVDVARLEHPPLEHRLRPGSALDFAVDASRPTGRATRQAGGVSFHRVAGWSGVPYNRRGDYVLPAELEAAIRDLRLPMTRFYGVGDEPFGLEGALDRAAALVSKLGIPQDWTVLELETQGATSKLPPEVWAAAARHAQAKGYGFRYWEVANEPYLGRSGQVFTKPDEYVAHVKAVAAAIRQVQPQAQIGLAIAHRSEAWGNYVLQQAAGAYDFVVAHYYNFSPAHGRPLEDVVLSDNYRILDEILKVNALLRAYNPDRPVYQLDTEWGLHARGPQGEQADYNDRNGNIVGTLHRAVRLIYYAREGLLRGASSWEMFTRLKAQGFGFLSIEAPEQRSLFYWLYWHFNRHVGDRVLPLEGTTPWHKSTQRGQDLSGPLTPVLATASDDGRQLYLVMVNGSWSQTVPCRAELRGFPAARATGTVLSQPDPDAKPFLSRKDEAVRPLAVELGDGRLRCALPPHSVSFITVERE